MDAFEPVIRDFVRYVVEAVQAEAQRFAADLEVFLGTLCEQFPRAGWQAEVDRFFADWTAKGGVAEPDDVRDLKLWLGGIEQEAILARQPVAGPTAPSAPQPPGAAPYQIPLPAETVRAMREMELVEHLEFFGQWIMDHEPPDRWLSEAEKIVHRFSIPPDLAARFLGWISSEVDRGIARYQITHAGARAEPTPEATFLSLLFEFAAGVDEFYAQNSPDRMFAALRELLDRFPKAIPDDLKGPLVKQAIELFRELFEEWLEFLEALPQEAWGLVVDLQQLVLDILGLVPLFGEWADVISAMLSLARREYFDVGLSVVSTAPVLGMISGGGKIFKRLARLKELIAKLGGALRKWLDDLLLFFYLALHEARVTLDWCIQFFRRLREKIRELIQRLKGSRPRPREFNSVPSVRNNEFNRWFDDLTADELDLIWKDTKLRSAIEDRLRKPGRLHEWLAISRTPKFKRWGLKAEQIKEMRTWTKDVKFVNPAGAHGKLGSTTAHNEIFELIDSSPDYSTFVQRLREWASRRLRGGVDALPAGLR